MEIRKLGNPLLISGLVIAVASIGAAVIFAVPYWYTPFLAGSLLLYDSANRRLRGQSTLSRVAQGRWQGPALVFLVSVAFAAVVDIWYGRAIADAWIYPSWTGALGWIVPMFLHYPLGMLALVENYNLVQALMKRRPSENRATLAPARSRHISLLSRYGRGSLVVLAICLVLPPLNYAFNENRNAVELLFGLMLVTTVAFDGVREFFAGRSVLRDVLEKQPGTGRGVLLTVLMALILNEGPNVWAREWIYTREPIGVPIAVVVFLGWFFLLSISLAVYEGVLAVVEGEFAAEHARTRRGVWGYRRVGEENA